MAITNQQLFIYENGKRKIKNSSATELLLQSFGLANGFEATTDGSGNLTINSKQIKGVAAGSEAGDMVEFSQFNTGLAGKLDTTLKGAVNGLAELDAAGKIPSAQIPALAINSTTVVADETARFALAGSIQEGDVAIQTDVSKSFILNGTGNGSVAGHWTEILAGGAVTSVNGQSGSVSLTTSDIAEGTNLYWTQARFDAAFTAKSTSDLSEGTNLYFTDARAKTSVIEDTFTNNSGEAIATGDICRLDSNGEVVKVIATDSLDEGDTFLVAKEGVANAGSGLFYKKGSRISGLTAATVGAIVELSRTTAGDKSLTAQTFTSGEHLVTLGRVISATEWVFDPVYEAEFA